MDSQDLICLIIRKDFLDKLKPDGLAKMASVFGDNSAYAQTIFAYQKNLTEQPLLFIGRTDGKIVSPRGPTNFGWDPCFEPDGFTETYAEMKSEQKNLISHRYKALAKFIQFLKLL